MCKADNLTPDSAWEKKRDYRDAMAKYIRPNRNAGRVQPKAVHLPRRGKMKARAA